MTQKLYAGGYALPDGRAFQGRFCRLERTTLVHADPLFDAFSSDDAGWEYLPYGPFADVHLFRSWLVQTCLERDPMFYTVLVNERPVGMLSLMRQDRQNGVIEVGHVHFSPALKHSAAATEAHALMMAHVFDDLAYRRYEWKCDAQNMASRKAAERLGFHAEGVFRQHRIVKGRNRDTAWFSILDRDWPAQKERFDTWLRRENFDPDGRQKTSLLRGA